MTTFPGSPRVTKGAIIGIDPLNPLASVIIFQYNPHELSRTLETTSTGGKSKAEPYKLAGPPKESIKVAVDIDAADQLEKASGPVMSMGIHPQLASLEMLLYPKSPLVIANTRLAFAGFIEVVPPPPMMTLFIWGWKRILPVRVTGFTITEQNHDVNLNPIQAKVDLNMEVMNYDHFSPLDPGYSLFLAHQVTKEVMSVIGSTTSL